MKKRFIAENNPHWKGGLHRRSDGYVLVRKGVFSKKKRGTKYILQHRLVMEKHLGRKLLRTEIVHHKNADRSDNRIRNLVVMTQSEHAKQDYAFRKKNKLGQLV